MRRRLARRTQAVALAMVGTIALLEPLGFRLTLLLMYLFLLYALGQRGWIVMPLVDTFRIRLLSESTMKRFPKASMATP